MNIPDPIFKKDISNISWIKIYDREYGVQYSEVAVSVLTYSKHFPKISVNHIVIPGAGQNTAFYIDESSWNNLVNGLNKKYTNNVKGLEGYEAQFLFDGKNYLATAKKIHRMRLEKLTDKQLLKVFLEHQDKRNKYSVFAWSAYILNDYVAERAIEIMEPYIKKSKMENQKQEIIDALFKPLNLAAIFQLQKEVEKYDGKLPDKKLNKLYESFKWLSCLDIQNNPWTKNEFKEHIKSFIKSKEKDGFIFDEVIKKLKPSKKDLEYLQMAKRFVYIKGARDDYRRESVYYSNALWQELGRRMGVSKEDTSYLQDEEIIGFLKGAGNISKGKVAERKKGFVMYIGENKELVCLSGDQISEVLKRFRMVSDENNIEDIAGRVASRGLVEGTVAIVFGVKDLSKVKKGDIIVAITTHPDFVPAMRRAAAIVTDEGGITSHAAIVSRELNIPCIIGTKIATKVLKDGDLVEVDATVGTVKILKR